jgi:hypothetical protein
VLAALVVGDAFQAEPVVEWSIENGVAAAQRWGRGRPDAAAVRALINRLTALPAVITPELRRVVGRFL